SAAAAWSARRASSTPSPSRSCTASGAAPTRSSARCCSPSAASSPPGRRRLEPPGRQRRGGSLASMTVTDRGREDHLVWKRATVDGRQALYGVAGEGQPVLFL